MRESTIKVIELIKSKNFTIEQIAEKVNRSTQSIRRIELLYVGGVTKYKTRLKTPNKRTIEVIEHIENKTPVIKIMDKFGITRNQIYRIKTTYITKKNKEKQDE